MTACHAPLPFFRRCLGPVVRQDLALMRRLHRWQTPRWIRVWMISASRGGDGHLWLGAAAAILGFGGHRRFDALAGMALATLLALACFSGLKRLTRRPRPHTLLPHCWATARARDEFSFPSGHTLTGFAITTAAVLTYPALSAPFLFCALSVAVSRLVIGLHFLSDVIAGCALGVALGYCSVWLVH